MIRFDQPSLEEQERIYQELAAERRRLEFQATEALRYAGASWPEVDIALEMFPPQESGPGYLTMWAGEAIERLARNARNRSVPETDAERM